MAEPLHPDGKTRRFEPWPCPGCGYVMDAASDSTREEALPKEGDLSVCLNCAMPFVLRDDRWRELTDDELLALSLAEKRELSRVQIAVREFHQREENHD